MDIHRYNRISRNIDKTYNVTAENADNIFKSECYYIKNNPFHRYYRVTLFDPMRNIEVKDSDGPLWKMAI